MLGLMKTPEMFLVQTCHSVPTVVDPIAWLQEHQYPFKHSLIFGGDGGFEGSAWTFNNSDHAILFKLVWGGA